MKAGISPRVRGNFRCDLYAAVLFSGFNVVFNQFYVPIAIRAGATPLEVGLLTAAPAFGMLFSPLWGRRIAGRDPKPFVILPNLAGRSLVLLPALFGEPWAFIAASLAFHLLMGVQAPAYAALMTRVYPGEVRGRLMGSVRVAMGLCMIPLSYAVGKWLDIAGPFWPLVAAALFGTASALALLPLRPLESLPASGSPERPTNENRQEKGRSSLKGNRALAVFLIATSFAGFGNLIANPIYQIIQVRHLGLTDSEIGTARTVYVACLLAAYLIGGRAIDQMPVRNVLSCGLLAYAVVPMMYAFVPHYGTVLVASGVQGVGDAIWDIGILNYVFRIAPGREAAVFSLHLMLFGIRGSIAPFLSTGLVGVAPFSVILAAASLCGWIGAVLFFTAESPLLRRSLRSLGRNLGRNASECGGDRPWTT